MSTQANTSPKTGNQPQRSRPSRKPKSPSQLPSTQKPDPHWPFPATCLTSLQKLVTRLPREERGVRSQIQVQKLNALPDAPL